MNFVGLIIEFCNIFFIDTKIFIWNLFFVFVFLKIFKIKRKIEFSLKFKISFLY